MATNPLEEIKALQEHLEYGFKMANTLKTFDIDMGAWNARIEMRLIDDEVELKCISEIDNHIIYIGRGETITQAYEKRVHQSKSSEKKPRSCNRHTNCDEAEAKAGKSLEHCHDEGCEECFGN